MTGGEAQGDDLSEKKKILILTILIIQAQMMQTALPAINVGCTDIQIHWLIWQKFKKLASYSDVNLPQI